jgi:hypothetical protein
VIGLRHRTLVAGTPEYITVGPLFSGVVLRGVWLNFATLLVGEVQFGLAVQGNGDETLTGFGSGDSLIERSDVAVAAVGLPAARLKLSALSDVSLTIPVYYPVVGAPRWLGVAVAMEGGGHIQVGAVIEPERLVRPSMERGRAARAWPAPGSVLDELRLEAIAASG